MVKKKKNGGSTPAASQLTQPQVTSKPLWQRFGGKVVAVCVLVAGVKEFAYDPAKDYLDGKFDGEMALTIDSVPLNRDIPTYVFFPVGQIKPNDRFLVPIGLALSNQGQAKVSDVTISTRFDKKAKRLELNKVLGYHVHGSRLVSDIASEVNGDERYEYAVHRIKYLVPKEDFNLSEGAISYPIPQNLNSFEPLLFSAHQGLDLKVTVFSENNEKNSWDVRYRGANVKDAGQMAEFLKTFYAKQVAIDLRKQFSTTAYLWQIMFGKDVNVVSYAPRFEYVPDRGLYVPAENPKQYQYYKFSPYVWSLLFDEPRE